MDTTEQSKRKKKYIKSYSSMLQKDAEIRLKIRFSNLLNNAKSAHDMISRMEYSTPIELKDLVFSRLTDALQSEGYPEATIEPFKEVVVQDYVGDILRTIVAYFKRKTNNKHIFINREKEIISKDEETGGNMEFVIVDMISVSKDKYLIIIEAKRESLGKCLTQCLLSMKDAYDMNEDNKPVYGFTTTGADWQLVIYFNNEFSISNKLVVVTADMEKNKEEWVNNNSQLIDVIYKILMNSQQEYNV